MNVKLTEKKHAYRGIFKATSIMGSTSFINMGFNVVRAKVFALTLGPSGTGTLGLLSQVLGLANMISGLGVQTSAVRMIAASSPEKIPKVVISVRRAAWFTAIAGALVLCCLAQPISKWTFGHTGKSGSIALLAIAVFFTNFASSPLALLQGMRKLKRLAIVTISSTLAGTLVGIPCVLIFREKGLVFVLIALAITSAFMATFSARKILPEKTVLSWKETLHFWKEIFSLGIALTAAGFVTAGVNYGMSVLISHKLGVASFGLYQSAMTLSMVYANYILGAMGTDYYPQLTALANNRKEWITLVNRQSEMALAIATPGLMLTLVFAPLLLHFFFTSAYSSAADVMRWLLIGVLLQIVSWPLGYVLLAKSHFKVFLISELIFGITLLSSASLGLHIAGLRGVAFAFGLNYVFYTIFLLITLGRWYHFRWSKSYCYLLAIAICGIAVIFLLSSIPQKFISYSAAFSVAFAYSVASLWWLDNRMELSLIKKLKARIFHLQ